MRRFTAMLIASVAAVTAGLAGASTAQAAGADSTHAVSGCPVRTTSPMLSRLGDTNEYFPVPNGGFALWGAGWNGLYSLALENEPWYVNRAALTGSLRLWPGGSARTAELCVGEGEDSFRFFYKGTGQVGSRLLVRTTVRSETGTYTYGTTLDASRAGWQLSPVVPVPNHATDTVQQLSIAFVNTTPFDSVRTILVDDVLIDPWRSRNG
ncbi:hypothetical protein ACF3NS_01695 [Arsenicicoccus cauae]|uniref:hypothetical protein n=1 Tax=Arsenicicoccus cauae TaxID=2663847 RepID=UPI00370DABBB